MCVFFWRSKANEVNSLPEVWLDKALSTINGDEFEAFCATRRSAGLPFFVLVYLRFFSLQPKFSAFFRRQSL